MDTDTRRLIEQLHDNPTQILFVTAGAGTSALSDLLSVAGASRTLLEALVPYSSAAFVDFLGQTPKQHVAARTARLLAGRAYNRARQLVSRETSLLGLACTATIATDRPKRGQHRAHIAAWQPHQLICHSLILEKDARTRQEEEFIVSRLILNTIASLCRLEPHLDLPLTPADTLKSEQFDIAEAVGQLHRRDIPFLAIYDHGRIRTESVNPQVLLPGAFNPLHQGHTGLAEAAADILDQPVAFELSAVNVDKPPLPPDAIMARLIQFAGRYPVYVGNAPTFLEKARLYGGATFVVGYDTAVRIIHPRYYQNSRVQMLSALAEMQELGTCFLVAGRVNENGDFQQLSDLDLPDRFRDLFTPIPPDRFREDISSTALRRQSENQPNPLSTP